jgi:hypothetical protein
MFNIFRRKRQARRLLKEAGFIIKSHAVHGLECPFCNKNTMAVYKLEETTSPAGEVFRRLASKNSGVTCLRCLSIWTHNDMSKKYDHKSLQEFVDLAHVIKVMKS